MGPFPRRLQAVRFHFGWRLLLGGAKEAGMKGWRERAADVFTKHGEIEAKMKSAPGPTDSRLLHHSLPRQDHMAFFCRELYHKAA